eukprot:sb/3470089/
MFFISQFWVDGRDAVAQGEWMWADGSAARNIRWEKSVTFPTQGGGGPLYAGYSRSSGRVRPLHGYFSLPVLCQCPLPRDNAAALAQSDYGNINSVPLCPFPLDTYHFAIFVDAMTEDPEASTSNTSYGATDPAADLPLTALNTSRATATKREILCDVSLYTGDSDMHHLQTTHSAFFPQAADFFFLSRYIAIRFTFTRLGHQNVLFSSLKCN